MNQEYGRKSNIGMQQAIDELTGMIKQHYPDAQFRVGHSPDDSQTVHLITVIDVEDTDEILDIVVDRMMQLQIDEQLPLYIIPIRPAERALEMMRQQRPGLWPLPQVEKTTSI